MPSDPFLMTGFDKKMVHLTMDGPGAVTIEVDFLGDGSWEPYETLTVNGYAHHIFPTGFSAHWVRLTAWVDCTASAEFFYT